MKNAFTWCISVYHVTGLKQTRGIPNVTLKAAKNLRVLRSTGKSNISVRHDLSKSEV